MKKIILPLVLTILALVPLKTLAKVYMIVNATNETVTVFELAERPALVFSDYEMHVYCADRELTFDRRDVADVTFSDEKPDIPEPPTGITSFPAADDVRGLWQTDGSHILFRSLPAYAPVGVYSIDGQLLAGTHADHNGQAALDMSLWTKGMVIVRAGSMAVKVDCSKCGHRTSASSHLRTFENKSRSSLLAPRSSNNSFRADEADAPTDSLYINKGETFHVYNVDGIERILIERGDEIISQADSVCIEFDIDAPILERTLDLAQRHGKKVYSPVTNMAIACERRDLLGKVSCLVCNQQEAGVLFSSRFDGALPEEMQAALPQKLAQIGLHSMVVTMGAQGSVFAQIDGQSGCHSAHMVEVADTTGAGDAFFSGIAIGLTYGKSLEESCSIGAKLAASAIASEENVCGRFSPEEFGL